MAGVLGFERVNLVLQVRKLLARRHASVDGLDGASVWDRCGGVRLTDARNVEPPVAGTAGAQKLDLARLGPADEGATLDPESLFSFTGAHVLGTGVHLGSDPRLFLQRNEKSLNTFSFRSPLFFGHRPVGAADQNFQFLQE